MSILEKVFGNQSKPKHTFNELSEQSNIFLTSLGGIDWFFNGDRADKSPVLEGIYNKIAKDVAMLNVRYVQKVSSEEWKFLDNDNLAYVVGFRPNRHQTQYDFFYSVTYAKKKYGIAVIVKNYDIINKKTELESLELLKNDYLIKVDNEKLYYKPNEDSKERSVDINEVIILRDRPYSLFDDKNIDLSDYLSLLDYNLQAMTNYVKSSGVLRGLLKVSGNVKEEDLKNKVDNFVANFIDGNSSGVGAVDMNTDFVDLKKDYHTLDLELQKSVNNEIYKLFGLNEDIFTANAQENQSIAYHNSTLEPDLRQISQAFNYALITRKEKQQGYELIFTLPKFDSASLESWTKYAKESIYQGTAMVNEIRADEGRPPVPYGDVILSNLNAIPLSEQAARKKGGE